ncbi:MAG: T9SS type A sorting domain-containing protein, partial [Saprospiraceae bacterium]
HYTSIFWSRGVSMLRFIHYIEILHDYSLSPGQRYSNNLQFSTDGLLTMLPGKYYVGIFYKPSGGNWIQVENRGSYSNLVEMKVVNPNDIELNTALNISPGTTVIQGQSVSVSVDVRNYGNSTFIGQFNVGLYNLDGDFVQSIGTIEEKDGLMPNYHYQPPYLTFTSSSISAAPGTYLLAVQHKPSGAQWELTGSTYYSNPIQVTVIAPSVQPDQYEPNNSRIESRLLPVYFNGNNSDVRTTGSKCHLTSDDDYYKIELPNGYNYTVSPRINDSNKSVDGNKYTLDGVFSYSLDGSTWSDAFDDVPSSNFKVKGKTTIYFHVAPYFAGLTGTYSLAITVSRNTVGVNDNLLPDNIKIYPNPADDFVVIDFDELGSQINKAKLFNVQGQEVYSSIITKNSNSSNLPLGNMPEGNYFLQLYSGERFITKKIIIER